MRSLSLPRPPELRQLLVRKDQGEAYDKNELARVARQAVVDIVRRQAVVGVVYEELTRLMGERNATLDLTTTPPAVILMAGLQGSGKTTTSAKLAKWLREQMKKKVLLVSTDVYRPAAIEQLQTLAGQQGNCFKACYQLS